MATLASVGDVQLRPAKIEDCDGILKLIRELAMFENMEDQVHIDANVLRKNCFGDKPIAHCIVAELIVPDPAVLVGYSLYYPTFSTWEGICMYLEDIYVSPAHRSKGLGRLMWRHVTKAALDMGCSRLQLAVLDWNTFAKDFYLRHGCVDLTKTEEWHMMRLNKAEMEQFVKGLE